jgi:hypothetical protein
LDERAIRIAVLEMRRMSRSRLSSLLKEIGVANGTASQAAWNFQNVYFQFYGPRDELVVCETGECHLLLIYSVVDETSGGGFGVKGAGTYTLVDAMSGVDISTLSGWQSGWSYTCSDALTGASVESSGAHAIEFVVKRAGSSELRSSSIAVVPTVSFTPSGHPGTTVYWDGCLAGGASISPCMIASE